jgi:uncharacterized membrane protein
MTAVKKLPLKISGLVFSLLVLSAFAVSLSLYRIIVTHSDHYWFLMWNLLLAWLPPIFAWLLYRRTPKGLLWSWKNFGLFILWLLFLPNAFYLFTDFIHLQSTGQIGLMYDVVLIGTYAWCGFILGYLSLFLVHKRTYQRFGRVAHWLPFVCLLLSGFAIYLGRYLRWNSWDIIVNPLGLLFDLTDRIVNPGEHILTFSATLLFFAFLSVIYLVLWCAADALQAALEE